MEIQKKTYFVFGEHLETEFAVESIRDDEEIAEEKCSCIDGLVLVEPAARSLCVRGKREDDILDEFSRRLGKHKRCSKRVLNAQL